MRITKITVWQIDLPLNKPYWLSGGRLKFEKLDSTFVRIDTDLGLSGWGEGCPWGNTYLPAYGAGIRSGFEILAPALLGQDPCALAQINRVMDLNLPGHLYVKSPLDVACWDLLGQFTNMPLWQLMGADEVVPVPLNSSISTGTPDAMLADIQLAGAKGYRTHSVKIGGDDPNQDIVRIQTVAQNAPNNEKITFDVNRAWAPGIALQVLGSVATRGWIEQPCETLAQCAHVASHVPQPIMLDECMYDFQTHLEAWKIGACQGVKVKPNRVGGLSKALQIRDFGIAVGWQMHVEDLGGSVLADTAAIHLAISLPKVNRLASWLCHEHLTVDPVIGQGARNQAGFAILSQLAGLGVKGDENLLGEPVAIYQ